MTDPHPLHSQPLAPRHVSAVTVSYWAVYPDGRRNNVHRFDALRLEDAWRKEGIRVVTRVRRESLRVIGELEEE